MAYLHGVETIELSTGSKTIQVVKTGVIGLIGIAPKGPTNELVMVSNERDAAQFGAQVPGFTIPQSLDAIFQQGAGVVLVINVFDEATHTISVTAEEQTIVNRTIQLNTAQIGAVTILSSTGEPTAYVLGTDYTIDDYGKITFLSPAILDGTALKITYKKLSESLITDALLIGSVNSVTGARSGMKLWEEAYNKFGVTPKILIAPQFSQTTVITSALIQYAEKFKGITYIDAPAGTTVNNAITGRGPLGSINFNVSSKRAELLFPHVVKYDIATDSNVVFPYSAFKAGLRAKVDAQEGYWVSDSNHIMNGVLGSEIGITAGINDPTSDANLLNEKGITTLFNSYGTGLRTWGNRNASFPTNTATDSFVVVRRVADIVEESIQLACLDNMDKPINQGWIDTVRESVNAFIRTLIGRGALIGGVCKYNPDDNPTTELSQGHVTFEYDLMPPVPAEKLTFKSTINIEYLKSLV